MFTLTVETEGQAPKTHVLKDGENVIGRSRSADVVVESPEISRAHTKITVADGEAMAENLSQFGTMLDGEAIAEPVTLKNGQRLAIGKHSTMLFEIAADQPAEAALEEEPMAEVTGLHGAPDVEAPEAGATGVAAGAPVTGVDVTGAGATGADVTGAAPIGTGTLAGAAAQTGMDGAEMTAAIAGGTGDNTGLSAPHPSGEDEEFMTRAMQTRVASPEEIDYLKVVEQKHIRQRLMMIIGAVFLVAVLAIIFRPQPKPPEDSIKWPKNEEGKFLDAFVPAPSGGYKDGGFDINAPGNPGWKSSGIPGGLLIQCRIGRKLDVPLQITLQEELDPRFLSMTREKAIEDLVQHLSESGGRWNFDRPSSTINFVGKENGIPYATATYEREEDGSWFGVLTAFLHGQRRFSVRAEVPLRDKLRAENILFFKYVDPSIPFVRAHWEGMSDPPPASVDEMLSRARAELQRSAPATWTELETLLRAVLTKAVLSEDKDAHDEALQLLISLREKEALWFNSQRLAKSAAKVQGSTPRARRVTESTKAVFSNINDQRYYDVRKW